MDHAPNAALALVVLKDLVDIGLIGDVAFEQLDICGILVFLASIGPKCFECYL